MTGVSQHDADLANIQNQVQRMAVAGELQGGCDATMDRTMRQTIANMSGPQLSELADAVRGLYESGAAPSTSVGDGCNVSNRGAGQRRGR